jgi:hypothetical protein
MVYGLALGLVLGTTIVVANWEALRALHRGSVGAAAWRFGIITAVVIGGFTMARIDVGLGAAVAIAAVAVYWSVVLVAAARRYRVARSPSQLR